jgi:hypothetical protein
MAALYASVSGDPHVPVGRTAAGDGDRRARRFYRDAGFEPKQVTYARSLE